MVIALHSVTEVGPCGEQLGQCDDLSYAREVSHLGREEKHRANCAAKIGGWDARKWGNTGGEGHAVAWGERKLLQIVWGRGSGGDQHALGAGLNP
jgi:hypothetical protein